MMESSRDENGDENLVKLCLGTCCICGGDVGVRNVILLRQKCPTPGKGWGCEVCGLSNDGAIAVICDLCRKVHAEVEAALQWVCTGHPGTDGRTLKVHLEGTHDHDLAFHVGERFPF